jgi:hypothetical protein
MESRLTDANFPVAVGLILYAEVPDHRARHRAVGVHLVGKVIPAKVVKAKVVNPLNRYHWCPRRSLLANKLQIYRTDGFTIGYLDRRWIYSTEAKTLGYLDP